MKVSQPIYTNGPDGHIVELATAGPGFATDATGADLGHRLPRLPGLEQHRADIEQALHPVTVPQWRPVEVFYE